MSSADPFPTPPVVRHLLVCEQVDHDFRDDLDVCSLQHLITSLRLPAEAFPFRQPSLWVFYQAFGEPGQYELWVELVRVTDEDDGEESEVASWGPFVLIMHADQFIESRGYPLARVPFPEPGLYEFRLRCGPDVIARERLLVEG